MAKKLNEGFTWDLLTILPGDGKAGKVTVYYDEIAKLFQVKQNGWDSPGIILSEKQLKELENSIAVFKPGKESEFGESAALPEGKSKKPRQASRQQAEFQPDGEWPAAPTKTTTSRKRNEAISEDSNMGTKKLKITKAAVASIKEKKMKEANYSAKKAAAGKDIGKPGKNFSKIAKSAGKKYGSKKAGERVAGAVLNKLRAKEDITVKQLAQVLYESGEFKTKTDATQEASTYYQSGKSLKTHPIYVSESVDQMSFRELVQLVIESGGQQKINPVDDALWDWAERVAATKVESRKQELYTGLLYERYGGKFKLQDVLSESSE